MARNRKHNSWLILVGLAVSGIAHPAGALIFELTRETPKPTLLVTVLGDGQGAVQSIPVGIDCGSQCSITLEPGSLVRLHATVGENSTFEGWTGPCGSQAYTLFEWTDTLLFPLGIPDSGPEHDLHNFLVDASVRPLAEYPLECEVSLGASVDVVATFGVPPEEIEIAMLSELPDIETEEDEEEELDVVLPKSTYKPEELLDLTEEEVAEAEPEPKPEPKLELSPTPVVAVAPPPPPIKQTPNMLSVEVPDENEVEEAPDDATFLSDKNRDVAEETRAIETNLDKASNGESIASSKSDIESEEVGGEEAEIAELDDVEETAKEEPTNNTEARGSQSGVVVHRHSGDDGDEGDEGEQGDGSERKAPGLLSMRNIAGRGALGSSGELEEPGDNTETPGGTRGKIGRRGNRGPNLRFKQQDYERLVGKEVAETEVAVTERKQSRRRGRWKRKQGMIKSALENFTPQVKPGNQTALKTRAAPFALYIARMHRGIHKRWGFGFLEGLSDKSGSNPMNDMSLVTLLEIVINPNGSIHKMTIVRNSGLLTFDVAALDVVDSSGPYERTPEKIRSADGKVYIHWSFHRGPRQCGTFNASPFILSSVGPRGMDDTELLRNSKRRKKRE